MILNILIHTSQKMIKSTKKHISHNQNFFDEKEREKNRMKNVQQTYLLSREIVQKIANRKTKKDQEKLKGFFCLPLKKKLTRFLTTHQKASYNFCIFYETSGKLISLCFFCVGIDSLQNRIVPGEFSTLC